VKNRTSHQKHKTSRIAGRLKNSTLSSKISLLVCCVVLTVFLFTVLILVRIGRENVRDLQDFQGRRTLEYVQILVEKEQQYMLGLAEYYSSSSDAQRLIRKSNRGEPVFQGEFDALLRSTKFKMYLLSVVVYNLQGDPLAFVSIDNSYSPSHQNFKEGDRPVNRLLTAHKDIEWEYIEAYSTIYMDMDHSPKLVLWKKVRDAKDTSPIGVVALAVDVRRLMALEEYKGGMKSPAVLLSDDNRVVLDKSGLCPPQDVISQVTSDADDLIRQIPAHVNGEYSMIYYQHCGSAPFIACVVARMNGSAWTSSSVFPYIVLLICIFLLALLPVSWFSSRMLTRPLKVLAESMTRFSKGDYSAEVSFKYNDDIGRLGQVFNHMVEENKLLVERNYVLKLREREAELAMLQMQIDPHFLYNMIHSIYWCAMKNRDEETADVAYNLGQFFRLSLNRGGEFMPVSKCIELVACYLELQKQRFGNRIAWEFHTDPAMRREIMPKLILQPIVENAVIHGMGPAVERLFIRIEGRLEGEERMTFCIQDNGVGISREVLSLLPDRLDESTRPQGNDVVGSQQFALKNISERLHILYGEDHTFSVESKENSGTTVVLSIPTGGRKESEDDTAHTGG